MSWILGICGVICFLYFLALMVFAGPGTSFVFIWLVLAIFFGFAASGKLYSRISSSEFPLWLRVAVATLTVTGIIVFVIVEILVFTGVAKEDTKGLDYVIVLGAKVQKDGISKTLQMRLDKAIQYANENPDTIFVLSGGKGKDEPIAEAQAMYAYMVYNGVPEENLLMELQSSSTVENLAYSRLVIENDRNQKRLEESEQRDRENGRTNRNVEIAPGEERGDDKNFPKDMSPVFREAVEAPPKPVQIGVLTSDFHLYRAMQIGEKWGIPDIQGIAAPSELWMLPHFCVRECAAILKDKLMGNM